MTVENVTSKQVAQKMGTLYTYPFSFTVLLADPTEDEALRAIKAKIKQADGSEKDLVYGSEGADGYTVTLNSSRNGGSVTVKNKRTSNDYIIIYREYDETQEADYQDFNAAPAETYEQCFDKLTMICQQQQEQIDRSVKIDMTSDTSVEVFADKIERIYDSVDNIDIVADNNADVSTVADNISSVKTTAGSIAGVNTTAANIGNVNICGQNISDINTCADDIDAIIDAPAQAQAAASSAQAAAASETAAASSKQAAYLSEVKAATSEDNAEIWAEGTDEQVQALGGTHSSKVWAVMSAEGGADQDLSNLTSVGEKHFVNKTQLPPGVLEVPQNIKYTLNNGTFTLKAGSILTVPYGTTDQSATYPVGATFLNNNFKVADTSFYSGKFFVMAEVQADISLSSTNVSDIDTFLIVNLPGNSLAFYQQPRCKSGTTQPTDADLWYNTSTNRFLNIQDTATQINYSFPIVAIRRDSGTVDSVLRVFNGFGYFGKAVWINKGVTMLCPNGKNSDGTNNNMVRTSDEVLSLEVSSTDGKFLLMKGQSNNAIRFSYQHFISQSQPQPSSSTATWYNPALNKMFTTSNKGVDWTENSYSTIGTLKIVDSSFLSFDDATGFVAADDNAVVHNYGDEEINGAKTFNGAMTVNSAMTVYDEIFSYTNTNQWQGLYYKNLALDITKPPADAYGGRFVSFDKNGVYFGVTEHGFSNNIIYSRLRAHKVVNGVDKFCDVAAYIDNSGNCYGVSPTYTNYADSSTKIVTTAYMANHWTTSKATTSSTASKARPAVVIQNYISGANWYRVWSDGWIEQGGRVYMTDAANQTLNFNKAFTTTNYTIVSAGESYNASVNLGIMERYTSYVIVDNGANVNYNWYAAGY